MSSVATFAPRGITIAKIGNHPTIGFAVEELRVHLKRMDRGLSVDVLDYDAYAPGRDGVIWVGIDPLLVEHVPTVADAFLDDAVYIEIAANAGIVTGSNPRSVLGAVYRLLRELGCEWVRPGADGEIIPALKLDSIAVSVQEKASHRHRSICIEGSNTYEHVRAVIEWMPKMNLNGYFIQFLVPFTFFDRWYSHPANPLLAPERISREDAAGIKAKIVEDVRVRGLLFHDVGHGWTCEPFGIEGTSWDRDRVYDVGGKEDILAMIGGQRKLHGNVPLNTNLCYSKPVVRETIAKAIADYCEMHPEVDYLHFWLGDGLNNHCECESCRHTRPSDYYVMMMNELDRELTRRDVATRIAVILYVDTLWAPLHERILNENRFALIFAPITRTYVRSMAEVCMSSLPAAAPYERNRLMFPRSLEGNLALLAEWKKTFSGDSFDFDYHLMWDHYYDPGYYRCAQVLFEDMKNLSKIGLNGMLSCQTQRVFFPTGLPVFLMARALWDNTLEFQSEAEKFHLSAFGPDGLLVLDYVRQLSAAFHPESIRDRTNLEQLPVDCYDEIGRIVSAFRPVIEANRIREDLPSNQRKSWAYLGTHAELCVLLADFFAARLAGDENLQQKKWLPVEEFLRPKELELQGVFDYFEFLFAYARNKLVIRTKPLA